MTHTKQHHFSVSKLTAAFLAMGVINTPVALAQGANLALEEIIVTAQKREENVQDIPVSVTAIGAETIEALGIQSTSDIVNVSPSLTLKQSGKKTNSSFSIRGIGTNTFGLGVEQAVALIVDDVALINQGQAFAVLNDVERIEVLRGPQSTLFGKAASAGVISVTTKKPEEEFTGSIELDVTEHDSYRTMASVSGPITDDLGFRFTAYKRDLAAFVENISPGQEDLGGEEAEGFNTKLYWALSDTSELTINAYYNDEESQCCGSVVTFASPGAAFLGFLPIGIQLPGITIGSDNAQSRVDTPPNVKEQAKGMSVRASFALGEHEFLSITAYDEWSYDASEDFDGSDFNVLGVFSGGFVNGGFEADGTRETEYFSQEFRLISSSHDNYDYVLGAFYADSSVDRTYVRNIPIAIADSIGEAANENMSVFGQFNWHLSDATTAGLGLRYLKEDISGSFLEQHLPNPEKISGKHSDDAIVGKVYVKHSLSDDTMVFASYTKGHKGQALDITAGFTQEKADNPVAPESVDAYELGIKSGFLDGRVQINLTAFHSLYDDFQVQSVDSSGAVVQFRLDNVGELRTQGIELESVGRLSEALTLTFNAAYMDAVVNDYVGQCYTGQSVAQGCVNEVQEVNDGMLPNAPELKYTVNLNYQNELEDMPFDVFGNLSYTWQDDIITNINQHPRLAQEGYGIANIRLGLKDKSGRYEITVYANNLLDENYFSNATDASILYPGSEVYAATRPRNAERIVGLKVKLSF